MYPEELEVTEMRFPYIQWIIAEMKKKIKCKRLRLDGKLITSSIKDLKKFASRKEGWLLIPRIVEKVTEYSFI